MKDKNSQRPADDMDKATAFCEGFISTSLFCNNPTDPANRPHCPYTTLELAAEWFDGAESALERWKSSIV